MCNNAYNTRIFEIYRNRENLDALHENLFLLATPTAMRTILSIDPETRYTDQTVSLHFGVFLRQKHWLNPPELYQVLAWLPENPTGDQMDIFSIVKLYLVYYERMGPLLESFEEYGSSDDQTNMSMGDIRVVLDSAIKYERSKTSFFDMDIETLEPEQLNHYG